MTNLPKHPESFEAFVTKEQQGRKQSHTPTPCEMELPLTVVQGYTSGGRKQLPYVSIWLDRLNHAQIHGMERGRYAAHIVHCVNLHEELVAALRTALATLSGVHDGDGYTDAEGDRDHEQIERLTQLIKKAEAQP